MNADPKPKKSRSPNHPSLSLQSAVEKVKTLHAKYRTAAAPILNACQTLGYNSLHSTSNQAVAALKAYGLIKVVGAGAQRKIAVTEVGDRIARGAPDAASLLREAALQPPVHREVVKHYGGKLPHEDILRQYLVWEREEGTRFNEDAVDDFISRLRVSLEYAGIDTDDKQVGEDVSGHLGEGGENEEDPEEDPMDLQVGSFVQWTSNGVDQFSSPRPIVGFSEDGNWAYVEDSKTGIPVSELNAASTPDIAPPMPSPPVNPFFNAKPPAPQKRIDEIASEQENQDQNLIREEWALDEGTARLYWPQELSPESVDDFEYWMNGLIRKARRRATARKAIDQLAARDDGGREQQDTVQDVDGGSGPSQFGGVAG